MISERAYKHGRSVEEAMEELYRCCGTQFDPNIVEAFVRSLEAAADSPSPSSLDEPVIHWADEE
jgi:HD-GYP domain-containing protein (c-di-GMP phosphodiesterase class II)